MSTNVDFTSLKSKMIEKGFKEFHEGNFHDAEEIFEQFPEDTNAKIGISMLLYNASKLLEALSIIEDVYTIEACSARCTLYKALGDRDKELESLEQLYELSEGSNWLNYSEVLLDRKLFDKVEPILKKAATERSHILLADCYVHQSRLEEARSILKAILKQNKNSVPALMELCSIATEKRDLIVTVLSELSRILEAKATHIDNIPSLLNMLAKSYELLDDLAKAAVYYTKFFNIESKNIDIELFDKRLGVKLIEKNYTKELINRVPKPKTYCPMIFILGMPRSGSTLIEQTLVAHSKIETVGETTGISEVIEDIQKEKAILNSPEEAWAYYKDKFSLGETDGFIIDKMPGNFHYIGLIYQLFPNAKFIYSHRDPLDNCVGCMTTHFRQGHPYSKIPEQTAKEYVNHLELIDFWKDLLPEGTIISVKYEDMVTDHALETKSMLSFLGLDTEPACEKFYEVKRDVRTASLAQVVKPIYTTSIGRGDRLVNADVEGGAFRKLKEYLSGLY